MIQTPIGSKFYNGCVGTKYKNSNKNIKMQICDLLCLCHNKEREELFK